MQISKEKREKMNQPKSLLGYENTQNIGKTSSCAVREKKEKHNRKGCDKRVTMTFSENTKTNQIIYLSCTTCWFFLA